MSHSQKFSFSSCSTLSHSHRHIMLIVRFWTALLGMGEPAPQHRSDDEEADQDYELVDDVVRCGDKEQDKGLEGLDKGLLPSLAMSQTRLLADHSLLNCANNSRIVKLRTIVE